MPVDPELRFRVVMGMGGGVSAILGYEDSETVCEHCHAVLWGHGVYNLGPNLRVRLDDTSLRFEAMLTDDGELWFSDEAEVAVMAAADVEVVTLAALWRLFDDATALQRWLDRRGLTHAGNASGRLIRAEVGDAATLRVWADHGGLAVIQATSRPALHLLHDLVRSLEIGTVDELAAFLTDHDVTVVRSSVPAG